MTRERLSDDYKRKRLADLFGTDECNFRFMPGIAATRCYTALKTAMEQNYIPIKNGGVKRGGISIIDVARLNYKALMRVPNIAEQSATLLCRALKLRLPTDGPPVRPKITDFARPFVPQTYRHITIVKCRNECGVKLRYTVLASTPDEAFQEAWRAYRDLKYMDDEMPPKWFKAKIVKHIAVQRVAQKG